MADIGWVKGAPDPSTLPAILPQPSFRIPHTLGAGIPPELIERIAPALILISPGPKRPEDFGVPGVVRHAARANVRSSVNQLRHGSEILEQLVRSDGLLVVGAEYSLESGVVDFFDGVPERG